MDARLTHPNPITQQVSVAFTAAIAHIIADGCKPAQSVMIAKTQCDDSDAGHTVEEWITGVATPGYVMPAELTNQMGWCKHAFCNALWELLHGNGFEESLVRTIRRGGDTDTNGAITGALLGAHYGLQGIPDRWRKVLRECKPVLGYSGPVRPRPRHLWPCDAEELAVQLLTCIEGM